MEPLLRDATREIIVVKLDFQDFKSYVTLLVQLLTNFTMVSIMTMR